MIVPFAFITVTKYFGITGVITYSLGFYLLMILNNYWYQMCRTLINENLFRNYTYRILRASFNARTYLRQSGEQIHNGGR